ncbi:hypothetical protein DF213_07510 [Dickeya dianthicola]|uniref:Uncharacterized protein n=1 Tax=Dickeya dianthicola TaxID=204039 RepID=A0AAX1C878_9GAMM|nr:hypothetical protein DF213_07510 [Dickeya dianthicola]
MDLARICDVEARNDKVQDRFAFTTDLNKQSLQSHTGTKKYDVRAMLDVRTVLTWIAILTLSRLFGAGVPQDWVRRMTRGCSAPTGYGILLLRMKKG